MLYLKIHAVIHQPVSQPEVLEPLPASTLEYLKMLLGHILGHCDLYPAIYATSLSATARKLTRLPSSSIAVLAMCSAQKSAKPASMYNPLL